MLAMRLLDSFCRTSDVRIVTAGGSITEGTLTATLTFDPAHPIFEGHFPGQPVVPGVTMMQIVRELLETHVLRRKALVKEADALKFLTMIDPRENATILAEIKYGEKVVARFYNETTTFFKMTATLS